MNGAGVQSCGAILLGSRAPLAELTNVSKRYGNVTALEGVNLQVGAGELVAVLGPNGAGKSTAIALLLGLQQPDSGRASLFGRNPSELDARRQIGVMMQDGMFAAELRVREHIALACSYYPNPLTAQEAIALARVEAIAERRYGKLSGGQKRQAQFAVAICGRPALLFLDEPTTGLDIQARENMWAALRRLIADGVSIVLTTHYLEEAEALASRVCVIARGKMIAEGTVKDISSVVARNYIGCSTTVPASEVATWAGVASASLDGSRMRITATNAESVVRRLLAADGALGGLEVRSAGLSEAFAALTENASV